MSNLMASLTSSGNALDVFQQALNVLQNNVNNAATPGYAAQSLNLAAQPLVVTGGMTGGVAAQGLHDSRDQYAEEQVQLQTQALGFYTGQAQGTGALQNFFDVSGNGGLPAALNNLLSAFSSWSTTPNDNTARQNVLAAAQSLAGSVNGLAKSLSNTSQQFDGQINGTVSQINAIATQIQTYNEQIQKTGTRDPGSEANLYSALDNLSHLTNFTTVRQTDGTITVMLGGGTPLVIGRQTDALTAINSVDAVPPPANPASPPTAHIVDSAGTDLTSEITGGQLGGLLDTRNRVLGSLLGDSQQAGSINQFAATLATTVNQLLESGKVSTDAGAASGVALFTFDASDATHAAATLAVSPTITGAQLAPVDASGNANGVANQLADLGNAGNPQGNINGMTMVQFLAQVATNIGRENQTATNNQTTQQQIAAQATTMRSQISGVSLDKQAVEVLQFQRGYQAAAQVLTTLNTLANSLIQMMSAAQ